MKNHQQQNQSKGMLAQIEQEDDDDNESNYEYDGLKPATWNSLLNKKGDIIMGNQTTGTAVLVVGNRIYKNKNDKLAPDASAPASI